MGRLTLQQRLQIGAQPIVQPQSVPAPITGWNTRDALDAMDPTDAVTLDNWFPDAGGVNLRNGYSLFASGMGSGQVQTLAEYNGASADKLLAGANGHIYNISTGTAVSLGSGFTSDKWQAANFLGKLFFVNGADTAQVFDGTSLANSTFTGVTLSTLYGVAQYQQRLFFWQKASTGFWYAPLNSITGALVFYDLASLATRGGTLVAVTTISHDGGNGVTNIIVFIMSSGDCILFLGNDPSQPSAWQMIGIYALSPPLSVRSVVAYGADAFLTTYDDHLPLQQQLVALKLGQRPPRSKVSNAVSDAVAESVALFGWQALFYPKGRFLLFNIPTVNGTFEQHIQNTSNGAWCRFTGLDGCCWGLFANNLYFGSEGGKVYLADTGAMDNGGPISGIGQQAWNTFGDPRRKRMTAVRPVVQSVGSAEYAFGVGFDYNDINVSQVSNSPVTASPWDTSPWDVSPWSPETVIDNRWRIGGGSGQAVGFKLSINALQSVSWLRTDFRTETGTAL